MTAFLSSIGPRFSSSLLPGALGFVLGGLLLVGTASVAEAQSRGGERQARPHARAQPHAQGQPHTQGEPSNPAGTELPSAVEPTAPTRHPSGGTVASEEQGTAKASSDPGTPQEPNQVPLDGLGWLAAFGVGYGLKRLHGRDRPGPA